MNPDQFLTRWYQKKINRKMKIAFVSAILFGLASHMFMMTNKLPNYDDVHCFLDDYGSGIQVGRWMLFILGNIVRRTMGNISLPWLNGLMCIFLLGITAAIVVDILEFKSDIICFLTGAVIVSFPAVTGTLFFMYTAVYYCGAACLAAWAVKLIKCKKVSCVIGGIFLISFAVGIYQAYFVWAVSLALLVMVTESLKDQAEGAALFKAGFRMLAALSGGLILYLLCMKLFLFLKGTNLSVYQNLDQMTAFENINFLGRIGLAYQNYGKLLWENVGGINGLWILRAALIILHVVIFVLAIFAWYRKKRQGKLLVALELMGMLGIFPLAVNLIYVISQETYVYSIMLFSGVAIYLLSAVMVNGFMEEGKLLLCCRWTICAALFIVSLGQIQYANIQYLIMNMQYEQATSYFTTMVTQIKSLDGYKDTLKIALIGDQIEDKAFTYNEEFDEYSMGGRGNDLINLYSRVDFLKRYLGYEQEILSDTKPLEQSEIVQEMPAYPDKGSMKLIENVIVVKLEN